MNTFGEKLRSEREHRGLSIEAVAETLGVDHDRLRALERNDFRALPGGAVMTDCLRAYAECLRVDAELMIEDYARERERCLRELADTLPDLSRVIPSSPARSSVERRPRSKLALAVWAVVVAVAILGTWWIRSQDGIVSSGDSVEPPAPSQTWNERPPRPAVAVTQTVPDNPVAVAAVETPPPAPVKAPTPPTSETSAGPAMTVTDYGVGRSIEGRQLVGRSDRFTEGAQVWFWTRVEGGTRGEGIEHVWLRDGVETLRIPLRIGGASWRTYSAKTLQTTGNWAVEARDDAGRVLARSEFACVP